MPKLGGLQKAFKVEITATTKVAASAARTWQVLSDTASYPRWNPFVRRLDGTLTKGQRIEVHLQQGDSKPHTVKPRVVEVEPGRSFAWLGHVGFPGLFNARHRFSVEPTSDGGSRLVQHETLSGLLTPLFRRMLTHETPIAFAALNDALAIRAVQ